MVAFAKRSKETITTVNNQSCEKDHWPHSGLLARLLDDIRVVRNGIRRPVCTVQVIIAESRLMLHSTESENFILS